MRRPRIDRKGCCEAHAQRDLLLGGRFAERWERMLRGPCTKRFATRRPVCREMGADVARPMYKEICCSEAGLPRDGGGCCEAHAQRDLMLGGRFTQNEAGAKAVERWEQMLRGPCRNVWSSEAGFPTRRGNMWREER